MPAADTVAIFAADKVSKVRELALLPSSRPDEATTRAKLAHYRASLEMLRGVAGNSALVDLLDTELNRLSHRPVQGLVLMAQLRASHARSRASLELAQSESVTHGRGARAPEAVTSVTGCLPGRISPRRR